MGVHTLVTGLNGAGKTLYTVATKLRPLSEATINYQGRDIPRRLVIGGIPDLLLPHELMEVPEIDPETFFDEWATVIRERSQPPVRFVRRTTVHDKSGAQGYVACEEEDQGAEPIVCSAVNWWAWCMPGDVIVIDECQRLFRPMASGRRVPKFIARLETARHYGVEFIYLTQHPQLLHVNVRNLVGPHEDVRRIFGTHRVMVYQWDKVSNPDRIAKATGRIWKHDKSAYGLYKSSELHTKFSQRLPFAVFGVVIGVVALGVLAWVIKGRMADRFGNHQAGQQHAAGALGSAGVGSQSVASQPGQLGAAAAPGNAASGGSVARWPTIEAEGYRLDREPYAGRGLQIEGGYEVAGKPVAYFGIVQDGQRIATVTLAELVRAGYAYTALAPCAGLLRFGDRERVLSCGPRGVVERTAPPAAASSGATA